MWWWKKPMEWGSYLSNVIDYGVKNVKNVRRGRGKGRERRREGQKWLTGGQRLSKHVKKWLIMSPFPPFFSTNRYATKTRVNNNRDSWVPSQTNRRTTWLQCIHERLRRSEEIVDRLHCGWTVQSGPTCLEHLPPHCPTPWRSIHYWIKGTLLCFSFWLGVL